MAVTLIVEDGTGAPNSGANTYVSAADTFTYMNNLGREAWADLDDPTVFIFQAQQQMEARYRTLWKGKKRLSDNADNPTANDPLTQPLSWPRKEVYDEDGVLLDRKFIPQAIIDAQMEIAWVLAEGAQFVESSIDRSTSGVIREKVGPIDVMYQENAQGAPVYPFIDQLLQPYLGSPGFNKLAVFIGLTDAELEKINQQESFDPSDFPEFFDIT